VEDLDLKKSECSKEDYADVAVDDIQIVKKKEKIEIKRDRPFNDLIETPFEDILRNDDIISIKQEENKEEEVVEK
jgi:chromosomal replication initiation ATPase DnaA